MPTPTYLAERYAAISNEPDPARRRDILQRRTEFVLLAIDGRITTDDQFIDS